MELSSPDDRLRAYVRARTEFAARRPARMPWQRCAGTGAAAGLLLAVVVLVVQVGTRQFDRASLIAVPILLTWSGVALGVLGSMIRADLRRERRCRLDGDGTALLYAGHDDAYSQQAVADAVFALDRLAGCERDADRFADMYACQLTREVRDAARDSELLEANDWNVDELVVGLRRAFDPSNAVVLDAVNTYRERYSLPSGLLDDVDPDELRESGLVYLNQVLTIVDILDRSPDARRAFATLVADAGADVLYATLVELADVATLVPV